MCSYLLLAESRGKSLFKMNRYKMVIISTDDLPFSVGRYLATGVQTPMTASVWAHEDWKFSPPDGDTYSVNLFEIKASCLVSLCAINAIMSVTFII